MSSARHLYLFCSHKLSEAYDAAQSVIQGVGRARFGRRYSPLAQDSSPSQGTSVSLRPTIRYVYAAACLLVVFGFVAYSRGGLYTHAAANATSRLSRADLSKDQYIAAVMRNPVEGLLDPEPIRQKCSETKFQEGLVWQCAAANGGIGNVANMVLNCVRYAVEAGGRPSTSCYSLLSFPSGPPSSSCPAPENKDKLTHLPNSHELDSSAHLVPVTRSRGSG